MTGSAAEPPAPRETPPSAAGAEPGPPPPAEASADAPPRDEPPPIPGSDTLEALPEGFWEPAELHAGEPGPAAADADSGVARLQRIFSGRVLAVERHADPGAQRAAEEGSVPLFEGASPSGPEGPGRGGDDDAEEPEIDRRGS